MHIFTEYGFKSECDAARRAADAAGDMHDQGMGAIDGDISFIKLRFKPERSDGIAEKQFL